MRTTKSVAFISWILEHLTFGPHNEALAGDLLEELHSGRSAMWYRRQALAAVAVGAFEATRTSVTLLIFSAIWTMLYPAWRSIVSGVVGHPTFDKLSLLAWPYSSLAQIGYGVTPAIVFVWLGFTVFLLLRRYVTGYGLILGLSQSLMVLLAGTMILVLYLKDPKTDLAHISGDDFYFTFHLCNISIPLAASLFAALFTLPRMRRIGPTKRTSRDLMSDKIRRVIRGIFFTLFLPLSAAAQTSAPAAKVQFVAVDQGVRLEVLDWGGAGRPLIFLTGLGDDAHVFKNFAPKFTATFHVYGITRRGFGNSSKPAPTVSNYTADRLGDDVIAVIDALQLDRPVLAGHSIAGEELSSIGSRHPEKVAGLIYLDAAFPYAYYNHANTDWTLDMLEVRKHIDALQAGAVLEPQLIEDMSSSVEDLDKDMQELKKEAAMMKPPYPPPPPPIGLAMHFGEQKYTRIPVPTLAIVVCPHNFNGAISKDETARAAMVANDLSRCTAQADAFAAGVPSAHVVRLPNTDHYVFRSNEAEVIREMNTFLERLP
jgi:non-heme chloroperoxidase